MEKNETAKCNGVYKVQREVLFFCEVERITQATKRVVECFYLDNCGVWGSFHAPRLTSPSTSNKYQVTPSTKARADEKKSPSVFVYARI